MKNKKNKIQLGLFLFLVGMVHPVYANESKYTTLETKQCRMLEDSANDPNAEGDYFSMLCPGRESYSVTVEGGDLRSTLVLKRGNTEIYNMWSDLFKQPVGQFPNVSGKVLEWRYDDKKNLLGLIVRVNGSDADTQKTISRLFVIRHTQGKFCLLSSEVTNEKAQKMLDSQKKCLK